MDRKHVNELWLQNDPNISLKEPLCHMIAAAAEMFLKHSEPDGIPIIPIQVQHILALLSLSYHLN